MASLKNESRITIGVVDVASVWPGCTPRDVIWETLEVAPLLEEWGFTRYWLAEHHEVSVAHSSPELLVPIIAGMTERLRVGVGGVLLNVHSPLKIAKDFRLLQAIYTDRIDLGVARGYPGQDLSLFLSHAPSAANEFPQKLADLLAYLRGTSTIHANPRFVWPPAVWLLGRGASSAEAASKQGLCFSLALHLNNEPIDVAAVVNQYMRNFEPSIETEAPQVNIALAGICAQTDEQAFALLENSFLKPNIVGSQNTCLRKLRKIQDESGVSEFLWVDLCRNPTDRRASYRLLSEAVGLCSSDENSR